MERRPHTDSLLYFHIRLNLVKRHMSGAFHHNLYTFCPRTFCQFAEADKLFYLTHITGISKTSGAAGISERNRHIVFSADIQRITLSYTGTVPIIAGHSLVSFFLNGWVFPCEERSMIASAPISIAAMTFFILSWLHHLFRQNFQLSRCRTDILCSKNRTDYRNSTDSADFRCPTAQRQCFNFRYAGHSPHHLP